VVTEPADTYLADNYARSFWQWLADAHRDVFDEISVGPSAPMATFDYGAMVAGLQYVDEFIAQSSQYPLPASG
jgi:hypothetical protein